MRLEQGVDLQCSSERSLIYGMNYELIQIVIAHGCAMLLIFFSF